MIILSHKESAFWKGVPSNRRRLVVCVYKMCIKCEYFILTPCAVCFAGVHRLHPQQEGHRSQQNGTVGPRSPLTAENRCYIPGLILGLRPANERQRYFVTASHWLGANLESGMRPANERRHYFVTTSLFGWVQT